MSSLRQPVLFIGHGSPMNALAENHYSKMLAALAAKIPRPKAIVVVSAHWATQGTQVTAMEKPKTIHDFYGFPPELFAVQYPAPGSPQIARQIIETVKMPNIVADHEAWGLDHGTWSVLRHIYPKADLPVLQLSLWVEAPAQYHFDIGRQLAPLREQGILLIGSGNVVHNLRQIQWSADAKPYALAVEFDSALKAALEKRDLAKIVQLTETPAGRFSAPTPEHFQPLYYILGAADSSDTLRFEFEELQNASISMLSFSFAMPTNY